MEKLMTIKEVLEQAGVSRYTLYRDSKNGKIKAIYFGKNVRYRESDVKDYVAEKRNSKSVNYYKRKEN